MTFVALVVTMSAFAQSEVWWGYYQDGDQRGGLGVNAIETYDQAIFIPSDFALAKGKKIKAVRFFLRSKTNLKDVKVWLSSTLPQKVEDADMFVALEDGSFNGKDDNSQTLLGTVNEVELPEAYTITDDGVYVGYSFTMKNKTGSAGQYPIVIAGTPVTNSLFLRTSASVPEWSNFSGNYGNLALQVLMEGEFTQNALSPEDLGGQLVGLNEPFTVNLKITNLGAASVNDFDYIATIDGVASEEKHVTINPAYNVLGGTIEKTLSFEALTELGNKNITIDITKVNGQPNQAEKTSATGSVTVVEELFKRVVLVEEFTGESCPNCPRAANGLATVLHNEKYAGKIAAVCHHSGYGNDTYTTDADNAYTWFFNDRYTFAPAMMYDRWTGENKNYSGDQLSPCYSVGGAADISENVDKRLKVDAPVKVELEAAFNADKSKISVKVTGKRVGEWATDPARINLVLTEDSIKTTKQSGASGTFWHMHVSRAVNSTWGDIIDWNGDEYSYDYTFVVNSKWNTEQLKVVAYVHCYDSTNPNNCEIANAAIVTPLITSEPDAIQTIENTDSRKADAIYNLAGQRVEKAQHGIYIVGGKKIMVK